MKSFIDLSIFQSLNEPSLKLDDDRPFHQRFSFTNPVRLLEKKLHADKSAKDNKMKMSLEEELEALKKYAFYEA